MEELNDWIDDNYKPLVLISLGAIILLLTCFMIVGALAINEIKNLEMPDFTSVNEAMSKLEMLNSLLDNLPLLEELMNRCDNIDCIDRILGKISQWEACKIGLTC